MPEIEVAPDSARAILAATECVVATLEAALRRRSRASWVLAGGSTPLPLYRNLAQREKASLDWSRVDLFWGDERRVDRDRPASNYGAALRTLADPLELDRTQLFPVPTEGESVQAAARYATVVADRLADGPFDLTLLGVGSDGHTASLFGGGPFHGLVAATEAPASPRDRITMTPAALRQSRVVMFLACGSGKAAAVGRVLAADRSLPAAQISGLERTVWYLDRAAARQLPASA